MSISSVPFVKGMKALKVMPSLRRNFGACSVLMVKKAATDRIQNFRSNSKPIIDILQEYSDLSSAENLKLSEAHMTPEMKKEFEEEFNNWKKAHGLDYCLDKDLKLVPNLKQSES